MFKKIMMIAASSVVVMSAFAGGHDGVVKTFELTDGSKVFQFENGKMGMENKYGNSVRMKPGKIMETKDGQRLIMIGDEVARVESLGHERRPGNQP